MESINAKKFSQKTTEGDTIVAENSKGHGWEGDVVTVKDDKNGRIIVFDERDHVIAYHSGEETLYFGPGSATAVSAGILTNISKVKNKTQSFVWQR